MLLFASKQKISSFASGFESDSPLFLCLSFSGKNDRFCRFGVETEIILFKAFILSFGSILDFTRSRMDKRAIGGDEARFNLSLCLIFFLPKGSSTCPSEWPIWLILGLSNNFCFSDRGSNFESAPELNSNSNLESKPTIGSSVPIGAIVADLIGVSSEGIGNGVTVKGCLVLAPVFSSLDASMSCNLSPVNKSTADAVKPKPTPAFMISSVDFCLAKWDLSVIFFDGVTGEIFIFEMLFFKRVGKFILVSGTFEDSVVL